MGIRRLNVFKFFEDTNMLLPIETFHDVENNRVYTHTDELGTYCLMDMEVWLESIGITAEDMLPKTALAMFSMRSRAAAPVALNSDNEEEKQEYLDVVLAVYPNQIFINEVKEELKYVCKKIFHKAAIEGKKARIYFVSIYAKSVQTNTEGKLYAENYNEALYAINRQDIITLDLNEMSYRLALAMNYIANNGKLNDLFDEASEKYCFVIDVCSYPEADAALRAPEVLKEKGFKVGFSYNKGNTNEQKYIRFSSNGMCEPAKTESSRYNFGDFVLNCIFGYIPETQLIISSAGLIPIELRTTLQQNYEWYQNGTHYNEFMDTDSDGLADYEEIKFDTKDGKSLINNSNPKNVKATPNNNQKSRD